MPLDEPLGLTEVAMRRTQTLLLTRTDVLSLLSLGECIDVVEQAFRLHAEGRTLRPVLVHVEASEGAFHIKAGALELKQPYFGLKAGGAFFQNKVRFGMPNILGAILLFDGRNGYPLAVMDSGEITKMRTGAATAVAAKYLARPDSKVATICGCGAQGRVQLRSLREVLPIERVSAWSRDRRSAEEFAREMATELRLQIQPVSDLKSALAESDICVTCAPAKSAFVYQDMVPPGMFIAAVGSDSPDKQELDPELLSANTVVVDILEQCMEVGELHHAMARGMSEVSIYGELGEIALGKKLGRVSEDQIIIFDSTGTALQDVAAAAVTYERAVASGTGTNLDFFS
jgi:alanine dehydrogenase